MRVGVDFDNTIVCYDGLFHALALERGLIAPDVPVEKQAVRDRLRAAGREDDWTRLQALVYGDRMTSAPPFPGVVTFFRECRRQGIHACIISHKTVRPYDGPPLDLHACARRWLDRQGFFDPASIGLSPGDAIFELTREGKLARIATERCAMFVDDLPELLGAADFPPGVQRVLFDPGDHYPDSPLVQRMRSWEDITHLVLDASARHGT